MSRHRFVKSLNIDDEMDDGAISDGGDDMSSEQIERLESAVEAVKEVIGDAARSGFPDSFVRDVVWESYFDVEGSIERLMEEQARRKANKERKAAKDREKAQKVPANKKLQEVKSAAPSATTSRAASPYGAVGKVGNNTTAGIAKSGGVSTPLKIKQDQQRLDISGLNLGELNTEPVAEEATPKACIAHEKAIEEALATMKNGVKNLSLVIIGHVDAGKSTLMGRLLYELGKMDERKRVANERASEKSGKSSFSWAWELDGTDEERERGITMDVGIQTLTTPNREITILDAPGHKDFIPNMISGATQADCALLVVDASRGEFEAGFDKGGQTREHLILVRSLGVNQVVIAVNKLDMVNWDKGRYHEICELLKPFLVQVGYSPAKTSFVPVGAMSGVNLTDKMRKDAEALNKWYTGPTIVELLDSLDPPTRAITSPARLPISNVFKGQLSGLGVSGRLCSGVLRVGESVRVLPGDETATIKSIEVKDEGVSWAAAGSNITAYLNGIDAVNVNIGSVICPTSEPASLASSFTARIITFDFQLPITAGAPVELFHHSRDVPATITKLVTLLDRSTGAVVKSNPRVLSKGSSAIVQVTLRTTSMSGPSSRVQPIPLEPFSQNKEMGRVLLRRGGETIAAGIVLEIIAS